MKVAIIYNKNASKVINTFGMQNREIYNPKTVQAVAHALEKGGHNVGIIDGDMHVIERLHDFMPKVVDGERMGIVFNMAYGIQGESRYTHIPSMLEMLGIPYVGSSPSGHALALDKVVTKIILQQNNLPTPKFWVFSDINFDPGEVEYPVIVKPKMESVSFGLRVVDNHKDLKEAVKFIIDEFQQAALVEQFIEGREFAVGLLGNNPLEAFPVLEIDLNNDPKAIQTFEDKSSAPKSKICPANIPNNIAEEMTEISKRAFQALQLRDFARVDFRMDKNQNIYILELNSMASLGRTGSYIHAAKTIGYDFDMLVNKMLDTAITRYFTSEEYPVDAERFFKKVPQHVRMRGFIRGKQLQTETLLKQLVNTNTHYKNIEGLKSIVNIIKKQLAALGFSYETFPQVKLESSCFFSNTDDTNYDILILGSLDNDTTLSEHQYFNSSEDKLFGSGIWENKGGLAVLVSALQSLKFIKTLKKIKIGILLTGDNSVYNRYTSDLIRKYSRNSKYILGIHGAFLNGGLVTSRSGSALFNLQVSVKNYLDSNLVSAAAIHFTKIVHELSKLSKRSEGIIIAPNKISFISNITDPYVNGSSSISFRFNKLEEYEIMSEYILKIFNSKKSKDINVQFDGGMRRPAMPRNDKSEKLWLKIKEYGNILDIPLREEHRWSSSAICFVGNDKYKIDGLGPVGTKPNKNNEYILRHSLFERSTLLAYTLLQLVSK